MFWFNLRSTRFVAFAYLALSAIAAPAASAAFDGPVTIPSLISVCIAHQLTRFRSVPAKWRETKWIEEAAGGYVFVFKSKEGAIRLPIERWSKTGNPIVYVPNGALPFVQTQPSLPLINFYRQKQDDIVLLTRVIPVVAEYQENGSAGRLVIMDGHHRTELGREWKVPIYVEVTQVVPSPSLRTYGVDWMFQ